MRAMNLAHVVLLARIAGKNAVQFAGRVIRLRQSGMAENWRIRRAHLVDQCADAFQARFVVGFPEVHGSADLGMHFRTAQFFGGTFLPDGSLHQRGTGKEQTGSFRHQNVIAHYRQIRAAGHAHPHNRGDLRDAHRAHDRVVAEHAAEIVGVREHVLLQRQKHSSGIDQVNRRNAIIDGDVLRANHFLGGHREKRAGFHGGVVGNDHEQAPGHATKTGDGSRGRRAAPFLVHFVRRVNAQARKNGFPDRSSPAIRSRAVSRFFLCCDSMALAPPPSRIFSSSFFNLVNRLTIC